MTANLLITGGAGFIGSCFVAQAVARGDRCIVLDKLTYAGNIANLEWIDGNWTLVEGDICDRALVDRLLKEHAIDAIVHFAAESHVDNSISGPAAFIETNINGTFTLLEAARAYHKTAGDHFRFVHVSTDEVYGSIAEGFFTETSPHLPNSPYSASKAASDHLARAWFETYKLPVIITHCTNNYGPRQHPEKLIPRMIACALAGEKLPVYGNGKNIRDWIHVEDHAAGVMLALTKGTQGETYNFGGRAESDNLALVQTLCSLLDAAHGKAPGTYAKQIAFVTDRPGHDWRYAIDDSKAERELGFTRAHTLATGLKQTLDWYLNNQAWCRIIKERT